MAKKTRKEFEQEATNLFDDLAPKTKKELKQHSRARLIRPSQMNGKTVAGTIRSVSPSPNKAFKQMILQMESDSKKMFAFPATAVIASVLADITGQVEGKDFDWQKTIGVYLVIKGTGKVKTADGKRSVNTFEVYSA